MAKRLGPLLGIAILFAPLGASGGTPTDPELRGELLRMKDVGQAARDFPLTAEGEERVLRAVDGAHTARLKSTVAARGWPDRGASGPGRSGRGLAAGQACRQGSGVPALSCGSHGALGSHWADHGVQLRLPLGPHPRPPALWNTGALCG